jgi:fatty-acyl-CoA synthase
MQELMQHAPAAGQATPWPRTDWFEKWAQYSPDAIALKDADSGREYTYTAANDVVNRTARLLRDVHGVGEGDRFAVLSTNELEYVFLLFAAQKIGAILVPINFRLTAPEVEYILRDAAPSLLLVQRQFEAIVARIDRAALPAAIARFDGEDGLIGAMRDPQRDTAPVPMAAGFESPCMILYTSGTTGRPKGAIITPGMLFWNSVNTTMRLDVVPSDVSLIYTPLFHTGGWNVLTTPFLHRGAKLVFLGRFDADRVLELVESERVTILFGLPTIMDMLHRSSQFASTRLDHVRFAIVGGEPMSLELIRAWHARDVPIRQGYGLTEFGPNVFSLQQEHAERKIGSIGFPNFYIDARVVDDDGRELGAGEVGELALRGPVCTPGYWNNPEASAAAIRDGWFHTGDLVRRDEEGFYYVVDRKKDMYKSGGENVYPVEVEHFLRTHPAVAEVAVVGVPDPKWGEVGMAFVALKTGSALTPGELLAWCDGNLARFKIPKHVRFVDALPKGDSGKVQKRELKQRGKEEIERG